MTTTPPNYVRHTKKAEWGLGQLVESDTSHYRYIFQDGEVRSFTSASLSFLSETQPSSEEADALQTVKSKKRPGSADKKKPKKKVISEELRGGPDSTRKLAAAAPTISSLSQQVELFNKHFPKGFEDERYIDQLRGGHGSRKIGRQGVIDLAKESMGADALRNILLNAKGAGAASLYKKLLAKGKTLLSLEELESFNLFAKTPPHEQRLAEALFDMLHGQGPTGARLEAVTTALPVDLRTWRLCTFPGAFFHPESLLYVDPDVTFRQAHIVGVPVSFQSTISGATYEHLQAMAKKLHDELVEAKLKPRDLIDVHLFTAHTLNPDAGKKKLTRFAVALPGGGTWGPRG